MYRSLLALGWNDRWAGLLAEHAHCEPARVIRHDGSALLVTSNTGTDSVALSHRLDPEPVVGDWLAMADGQARAVLARSSLLRRRSAMSDAPQALAANLDVVLLVAGLDRPVKAGRLTRGMALARDAGATPVIVLTKVALVDEAVADEVRATVARDHPGIDVLVTSVVESHGLDPLRSCIDGRTATLLGESGAGKSSIVNALLGSAAADVGRVRTGDAKGRHTTTARELHVVPSGGVLIDTPGIRSIGLWVDPDAVDATFADIDDLADGCRFVDCGHDTEPGCAVRAAVDDLQLAPERLASWRQLEREAAALALRSAPHERRRNDRRFARVTKDAQKRKGRA